jgi:hypothetical protein
MAVTYHSQLGPWHQVAPFSGSDPYYATGANGSYTSGTFSPPDNSLLVLIVTANTWTNSLTINTPTNSGTALTWTRLCVIDGTGSGSRTNTELAIYYALNTAAQTNITYTATWSQGSDNYTGFGRGHLYIFTGHNTTNPFSDSDATVHASNTATPFTTTQITQATDGAMVGGFTDTVIDAVSGDTTISVDTATSTWVDAGPVTIPGTTAGEGHFAAWKATGEAAGNYGVSMDSSATDADTRFLSVSAAIAAPATSATAAASQTAGATAVAAATKPVAGTPSLTLTGAANAGLVVLSDATPSVTLAGSADATVITTHDAEAAPILTVSGATAATLDRTIAGAATLTATATATAAQDGGADGVLQLIGAARAVVEGETSPGFLYGSVKKNVLTS